MSDMAASELILAGMLSIPALLALMILLWIDGRRMSHMRRHRR